ncbi:hypothetical protein GCM10023149_27930 [Mucilaginibacter gynuensis]|uniref:BD-FAE-like domain-containing protein n=1 Tax=Mucilaginibacter gynuensis TaxID=1302236 RepID=A0ABP8GJN2_9SPHI
MIRLTLLIILFLASLLNLFDAPAYYFWLLAIMVSEFPVIFAGVTVAITASGYWPQKYRTAGTILGIVTFLLFISPIIRSFIISRSIKIEMQAAFGSRTILATESSAFKLGKLFKFSDSVIAYQSLVYKTYPGISLTLDYYPSQQPGTRPCVIVIHGGSWSSGNSKQLPELNSYLAKRGYNVASVNYRLAPDYQNPAPVEDVKAALNYLRQNAGNFHIDTNKFVLLGRSAGAQIVLLAAYTLHHSSLKGVIDFYGPADMVWGYSLPANPWVMDSRAVMHRYLGGPYNKVPQNYVASSPIEFVDKQSPPTLIIHGANDVLVAYEHSRRLNDKLQQNGIKHYWLKLPWATHGFDYNLNGPGGQLSTYAVETFLNTVTQ